MYGCARAGADAGAGDDDHDDAAFPFSFLLSPSFLTLAGGGETQS